MRDQAAAGATWAGALVDLAESGAHVSLAVGTARMAGRLEAVGRGFCVLGQAGSRPVLIAQEAISAVWPETAGNVPPSGSRIPALDLSFGAALSMLAEERSAVRLTVEGGHQVSGDLIGAGEDVLTVRAGSGEGQARSVLVALEMLLYCELR